MDTLTRTLCAVIRGGPAPDLWRGWFPADWGRLVAAAEAHGVAGLLLRALRRDGWPAAMPEAARTELRARVHAAAGHNMRAYRALDAVLAAVGPATPLVVLKGAAIGPWLYPAPSLRPLTDVDLLAPPAAVDEVAAALRGLGFRPRPSMAPELARAVDPHLAMVGGPGGAVAVEVHWALLAGSADWRAAPLDWFWARTEPWRPPAGAPAAPAALQLAPTAALLYQCAHLVLQHGPYLARLIWIYDLHLLAASGRVDWGELVAQARRLGWGEVAFAALDQARLCFGAAVDPAVLAALRGPLDPRVRFRGVGAPGPYTTWDSLAELNLPTRLRLLARVALPSRAYLREQYEPRWGPWWPLAYPYRWLKPLRRLAARLHRA
jgi:hypothetical protein